MLEPNFSDGEKIISQSDGALHGRWHQTWITNHGIHVRKHSSFVFFPYSELTGICQESEFMHYLTSKPKGKLSLYQGRELLHRIDLRNHFGLPAGIRDAALEERINIHSQPTKQIDEGKLLENVLEHSRQVDGFFKHYLRMKRSGRKGIEKILGEKSIARIGGKAKLLYYINPVFAFPNWVVGIQDGVKTREKSVEPAVTVVYKPDIIFWHLFRYIKVTTSGSGSSSNPGSFGAASSGGNYSATRSLVRKKSFLMLCTLYKEYKFDWVGIKPEEVYRKVLSG